MALRVVLRACGLAGALMVGAGAAQAEGEPETLAAVAGEWRGNGTDRNSAREAPQPVTCRASNTAAEKTIRIKMSCEGPSGREDVTANLTVERSAVSGSMTRKTPDLPFAVSGSISGTTKGSATTFDVNAFFKTRARITVALLSRSLYRLLVTDPDGGATLMHVTFRKT
jgi:hypothetical protein